MAWTKEQAALYAKQYREKNKEILDENKKQYREKNKENILIRRREIYLKDKEKIKQQQKVYREKNKESIYKKIREWQLNNPEKVRASSNLKSKKRIKELKNDYVVKTLVSQGFPKESITPELIEVKRIILKTKRL